MRKLCSKWVPLLITADQKQERVDDSEQIWLLAITGCSQTTKNFWTNEQVNGETETNFKAKDKSFYKSGIKMVERMIALLLKDNFEQTKKCFLC